MPLPQNERGGIRGKTRECRRIYLFDSNKKPKAREFQEKK
jgi:hypothetical protein